MFRYLEHLWFYYFLIIKIARILEKVTIIWQFKHRKVHFTERYSFTYLRVIIPILKEKNGGFDFLYLDYLIFLLFLNTLTFETFVNTNYLTNAGYCHWSCSRTSNVFNFIFRLCQRKTEFFFQKTLSNLVLWTTFIATRII